MAQCGEHAAHLTVTTFEDRQLDLRLPHPVRALPFAVTLVAAAKADILCRLGRAIFEIDSPAQDIQGFLGRNAADLRPVGFRDMIAWMGQTVQEFTVIGQENQAFRINVQPADRAQHGLVAQIHQIRYEACGM